MCAKYFTSCLLKYLAWYFFFEGGESLIAFTLSRVWRWTTAPGRPGGLSLHAGQSLLSPSYLQDFMQ